MPDLNHRKEHHLYPPHQIMKQYKTIILINGRYTVATGNALKLASWTGKIRGTFGTLDEAYTCAKKIKYAFSRWSLRPTN